MEKEKRSPDTDDAAALLALLGKGKKRKISPKKLLVCSGAALALCMAVALILYFTQRKNANADVVYREYTVERGDLIVGQTESSSISLVRKVVQFPIAATVKEIYVKAGSMVKPGDPLVQFDVTEVQNGLASYRLLLEDAALELEQAKLQQETKLLEAGQKLEESEQKGELASANENLTVSQLSLTYENAVKALTAAQEEYADYCMQNNDFAADNTVLQNLKSQQEYYDEHVSCLQQTQTDLTSYTKLLLAAELERDAILVPDPAADAATWLAAKKNEITAAQTAADGKKSAYLAAAEAFNADPTDETLRQAAQTAETEYQLALYTVEEAQAEYDEASAAYQNRAVIQEKISYYTGLINSLGDAGTLEAELANMKRNQTSAQKAYTDYNDWFKDKYGNITTAKQLIDALSSAEAAVKKADLSLEDASIKSETGTMSAEHTAALSEKEAETASISYELTEMELTQKVAAAQENYNTFAQQLSEVEAVVQDDGVVYADHTGMIVGVAVSVGDKVEVKVNTDTHLITSYASILTVNVIDEVFVPITISEEDILSTYIGQEAHVRMTAFPDTVFEAVVDSISAESARAGAATVSYTVTVKFKEKNEIAMYEGMSAEVTLIEEAALDVLYVNAKAIEENKGKDKGTASALVKGEEENTVAIVTTGFSDGQNIEIVSGLSEGDVLLSASAVGGTATDSGRQSERTGGQEERSGTRSGTRAGAQNDAANTQAGADAP